MQKILSFLLFIIAFTSVAQKQPEPLEKIDSLVKGLIDENDPALLVGIVKDGSIIYKSHKGLASLQHAVKATESSRSNIASVAKQFTALMILDLALEKKLSLEDDIRTYLPKLFPEVKEPIKIRHLLNHTSGIRDYCDLLGIQNKPWWKQVGLDNDDVIDDILLKQNDLAFKPGSRFIYSNSGYIILAKIIEHVSEKKFLDYSSRFFKDLGMEHTAFSQSYMNVIPDVVLPYSDWGNGVWKQWPKLTRVNGDGALYTTLQDQLIYEQALQNAKKNKNELLLKSQQPIPNSEIKTYGFGLKLEDRLNYDAVHHDGSTGSYHAQTIRFTEEALTIFVMSSNSRLWSGSIADKIAQTLLPEKDVEIKYNNEIRSVSNKVPKQQLIGQYLSSNGTLIRIEEKEQTLIWKNANNNPIKLVEEDQNIFSLSYDATIKLGFFSDKLILFYPSGDTSVYSKLPNLDITLSDIKSYEGAYFSNELDIHFTLTLANDKLMILRNGWDKPKEVEVLNPNELLISNYILKAERDASKKITGILLTTNRILNNKFVKK